jgi:hypothetical protein
VSCFSPYLSTDVLMLQPCGADRKMEVWIFVHYVGYLSERRAFFASIRNEVSAHTKASCEKFQNWTKSPGLAWV